MELKDMILSTLAELEEPLKEEPKEVILEENVLKPIVQDTVKKQEISDIHEETEESPVMSDERAFCESLRERVLVLFEGFQSPNNKNIEAKVDLTLNFLEYLLAVVDERLEILDSQKK
jgi:hypothetical protein